jgi:hypothetical protein
VITAMAWAPGPRCADPRRRLRCHHVPIASIPVRRAADRAGIVTRRR